MKHEGKSRQFAFAALAILVLLLGSLIHGFSGRDYSGKMEAITIGTAHLESSALIYVADRQGYFSRRGLTVTVKDYETGMTSLNGLLGGEVDIAVSAEYALVGKALGKEDLRAIASIDKARYFYLVGRKDLGIEKFADLKGKRIGVVKKTIGEFYLGRLLKLNGINTDQVGIADLDISRSESAIAGGEVDAIICRPPHFNDIQKKLGSKAIIWPAQSSQALYAVLVGRTQWLTEHYESVEKLLYSLAEAEKFLADHPSEFRSIIKERLKTDDDYLATVWSNNEFSLSLDQAMILAMEDEARWMMKNDLTSEEIMPNFVDFLFVNGLRSVKPQAVSIIQ